MSNKPQKPKLNIAVVSGNFYWVRPFHKEDFEPAKCKELYGTDKLYFFFTNGSRMEVERAWEVEPLNYR
jgi:hypothetical protein